MKKVIMNPFWGYSTRKKLEFNYLEFIQNFLVKTGFKLSDKGVIMKTTDVNNTVYSVEDSAVIRDYITKFLQGSNPKHFEKGGQFHVPLNGGSEFITKTELLNEWITSGDRISSLAMNHKSLLKKFSSSNIFHDSDMECHLSFKNGIVKITKDKIQLLKNDVLKKKYRFTSSLSYKLHEDSGTCWNGKIEINDKVDGEFEKFIKSCTSKRIKPDKIDGNPRYGNEYVFNEQGYKSLMSSMGYLIHDKNLGGTNVAILLQDRFIDGRTRQGGNGKSLISKGLSFVRKVYEEEAKNLTAGTNFKYQGITVGDKIFFIDELRPKSGLVRGGITLHDLFTDITGSFKVEKKYQGKITLTGDDVPKILLASNYIVYDPKDSSTMRRIHINEFSDLGKHYPRNINKSWGSGKKLLGMDGHWNQEDWNDFYNFIFRCVQLYLKSSPNLYKEENQNWEVQGKKIPLENEFGTNELMWCENYIKNTRIQNNHYIDGSDPFSVDLFEELKSSVPKTILDETRMKKMFFDYCLTFGYEYNPKQKHKGDTPNKRKKQRTHPRLGSGQHCIHITHVNDPV